MNIVITNLGFKKESEDLTKFYESDRVVYEVIRIIDGVALFLEDHFGRLLNSMQIQRIRFEMDYIGFKQNITELIRINQKAEGNIRFLYSVSERGNFWSFNFIPHSYPTPEEYQNGVSTDLFFAERKDPNAKVIQQQIRDEANQMIADRKLFEVLMVDRGGRITEGSRSNVFFVKNDVFYTAPESMVLIGITRQKVLDCLKVLGLEVVEEAVAAAEIGFFDAAFITGTSPKVLPVRLVGRQRFQVEASCVKKLMNAYDQLIVNYVRDVKR